MGRLKLQNFGSNFKSKWQKYQSYTQFWKSLNNIHEKGKNRSKVHPQIENNPDRDKSMNEFTKAKWGNFTKLLNFVCSLTYFIKNSFH